MKCSCIFLFLLPCLAQVETGTVGAVRRGPGTQPPAAISETKPEDRGGIAGQVVNAATDEPVTKATVTLRRADATAGAPPQSFFVTSDGQGMFSMTEIEPGNYRLSAARTGYVGGEYGSRGPQRPGTTLSIGKRQKLADLKIRMTPHAVITGRVVDEDREPLANVQVQAMRVRYLQGRRQLVPVGGASTNDLGEFRMFGVAPGRCYLLASARGPMMMQMDQPASTVQGMEDVYAPAYYPSGKTMAEAIPLEIAAGSHLSGIDFRLSKSRSVRVKGRINNATGAPAPTISVSLNPRDGIYLGGWGNRSATTDPRGTFEIRGITPGAYVVVAMIYSEGGRTFTASQPVEVGDSNVENINLTVGPGMDISGQLRVEGETTASLAGVRVNLVSREPPPTGASSPLNEQGVFNLKTVNAGLYDVSVLRLPDGFYVKSIRAGQDAADVKTNGLDLSAGPAGVLDVVLSPKAGQVSGTAIDDKSQPVAGVTVVLMPQATDQRRNAMAYKTSTTDQNGRFVLKNLDPGEYKIFAWEDIEPGSYMDPDLVKPVEGRGQAVTVRESGQEELQVKIIPAE